MRNWVSKELLFGCVSTCEAISESHCCSPGWATGHWGRGLRKLVEQVFSETGRTRSQGGHTQSVWEQITALFPRCIPETWGGSCQRRTRAKTQLKEGIWHTVGPGLDAWMSSGKGIFFFPLFLLFPHLCCSLKSDQETLNQASVEEKKHNISVPELQGRRKLREARRSFWAGQGPGTVSFPTSWHTLQRFRRGLYRTHSLKQAPY